MYKNVSLLICFLFLTFSCSSINSRKTYKAYRTIGSEGVDTPDCSELLQKILKFTNPVYLIKLDKVSKNMANEMHIAWLKRHRKGVESGNITGAKVANEKVIPLAQENAEEALQRLETEGYTLLRVNEEGKLVQSINQEVEKIVPALNWKLNGKPAISYAEIILKQDFNTTDDYISAASKIHDAWMKNNPWEKDSAPHLFLPYNELTPHAQLQDLDVLEQALKAYNPRLASSDEFIDYKKYLIKLDK